ncbi:sigma-70 family RNA polymerase sigma factor [Ornithinibacillus sp. L9]|uniref:Sigma-70 family RNA polymerase sigma factor n=1 Tax=Ornithinibacillus caprae TaxID=2678566 RepID=A0A6N8FMW3_9BACI|nr:RNA polymerase sigma factor [Ornithinibacillus caprae]MUK89367.1 sigma-70 family RNA polymerase sigma factor [Ornithinibacillus caprae]
MTSIEKKAQMFNEKSRELREEFSQLIIDFREDLWDYCRYLTGSPWDGEDVFQETMLKAFGGFYQVWQPVNPKSYLYRVATNTWIDHCRREKKIVGTLEESNEPSEEFSDSLELEYALEHLVYLFTPRQVAVFLMVQVFKFKAEEVASIVKTTRGAIYATIRRMEKKLWEKEGLIVETNNPEIDETQKEVIQSYIKAINEGDLDALFDIVSDHLHNEASLGFQEFSKGDVQKGSMLHGLPGYRAQEHWLWGRKVIIIIAESENGPLIHDIQYQEVENGKIVFHRSYYFRKEFIVAAANELGMKPQLHKFPVDWDKK